MGMKTISVTQGNVGMKTVSVTQGNVVMKTVSVTQATCGDEDYQCNTRYMW